MENEKKQVENTVEKADQNSNAIQEIIEKAISDPKFKKALLEDPDKILDQYELSEITRIMLKSLSEEDYEKLTPENIGEYFSADSAIYTPDFDENVAVEYVDEDEI